MPHDSDLNAFFGDIHNHCGISYGHGTLEDALHNAALRLDFVSVTGHAGWPDMDTNDASIAHIVDFHRKGFAKLKDGWRRYLDSLAAFETATGTIAFPGYEIHSCVHGDYTVIGRERELELLSDLTPRELRTRFSQSSPADRLPDVLLFPHHIGYRQGARGINWESFQEAFSPVIEILSMHGMAEQDRTDKPFLHSMGPLQRRGTMAYGLEQGTRFGVLGNTDHHSGHPGSYGHGLTGVWANGRSREAIWNAFYARRTWAMTGDAVRLWFTVDGAPMGSVLPDAGTGSPETRRVFVDVDSTSAIDYVELVADGRRRFVWWEPLEGAKTTAAGEESPALSGSSSEAIVELELGWGERGKPVLWEGEFLIEGASILETIPRFRGPEVVSPLDKSGGSAPSSPSSWEAVRRDPETGTEGVRFITGTWGNMTNSTPSTQGFALRIDNPAAAVVHLLLNGRDERFPVQQLLQGSVSGNLGPIDSPAFRCRANAPRDYHWSFEARTASFRNCYTRVRLKNGHWAISSPVFAGE